MAIFPRLSIFEPAEGEPEWARFVISAYDHYIRPGEPPPIPYDLRDSPRRSEDQARYVVAEKAFWNLHIKLADGGVWRVRRERYLVKMSSNGRGFKDHWFRSHRALKGGGQSGFLELFYPSASLRIRHGWDLTDWALCGDETSSLAVQRAVSEVGLFVLPARPATVA